MLGFLPFVRPRNYGPVVILQHTVLIHLIDDIILNAQDKQKVLVCWRAWYVCFKG
jgi:uncharacterized protein YhhL (DUF1145 family)